MPNPHGRPLSARAHRDEAMLQLQVDEDAEDRAALLALQREQRRIVRRRQRREKAIHHLITAQRFEDDAMAPRAAQLRVAA